jgi:hypothetical protein
MKSEFYSSFQFYVSSKSRKLMRNDAKLTKIFDVRLEVEQYDEIDVKVDVIIISYDK